MIIAFEGIDNSGKTTISKRLADDLIKDGYEAVVSKELTTNVGDLIRDSFRSSSLSPVCKAFLFAADRQLRLEQLHIYNGDDKQDSNLSRVYLFDRYIYSALAYREAEGLDGEWVRDVNHFVPKADMNIYIDITSAESIARNCGQKFNIIYSSDQLEQVRQVYLKYVERGELIRFNGMRSMEDVYQEIKRFVMQHL